MGELQELVIQLHSLATDAQDDTGHNQSFFQLRQNI